MIENWEFCNLLGIFRRIGFKARLVNCREAAYLNNRLHKDSGQKAALTCEPERYVVEDCVKLTCKQIRREITNAKIKYRKPRKS